MRSSTWGGVLIAAGLVFIVAWKVVEAYGWLQ